MQQHPNQPPQWNPHGGWQPQPPDMPPAPAKRPVNAFFMALFLISAAITAYFVALWVVGGGGTNLQGILMLWSAGWTYVWWKMRHR